MSDATSDGRRSSRPLLAAVLLAALFGLAELPFAAFMADDLIQLSVLEGVGPCPWVAPWQAATISAGVPAHVHAMQDAGALPWFFGARFQMAFFRPLSSLLLVADHAVWGLWPAGYRLQGIAWFVLLVIGLGLVLRRVLPGPIGALALLVFTVSGIQASLVWNATRHIAIAGALATLSLAAHIEWREAGWRAGRAVSILGLALALSAGEAALAGVAYLLAYEAWAAPGAARARGRAVAPAVALIALYLAAYRLLGFGAGDGGGYTDPLRAPLAFLVQLPGRWLFLLGALVAGGNADLWLLRPDLRGALGMTAAALVGGFACLLWTAWPGAAEEERRGAGWLIAGAALSALPFVGAPLGSRCLVLPMLGGAVAIAFVLQRWWAALRHRPGMRARLVSAGCVLLAVIHLVLAPIERLAGPYVMRRMLHDRLAAVVQRADLDPQRLTGQRVVILRAPDFIIGLHAYFFRALYRLPMPRSWRTLSWAPCPHRFTRTAADTLELELAGCAIGAPHLAAGDSVVLDGLRATVLARDATGPTRVAFRFDRPLDDPDLVLLRWRDDRLERVAPPAVGQATTW